MNAGEKAKHIVQSRIEGYQITRHPWSEGMIAAIERAIIDSVEEDRKTRDCCKAERDKAIKEIVEIINDVDIHTRKEILEEIDKIRARSS